MCSVERPGSAITGHKVWAPKTRSLAMLCASFSVDLEWFCSSSLLYPSMQLGRSKVSTSFTTAYRASDGTTESGSLERVIFCLSAVSERGVCYADKSDPSMTVRNGSEPAPRDSL
jgi:hypothetical protein